MDNQMRCEVRVVMVLIECYRMFIRSSTVRFALVDSPEGNRGRMCYSSTDLRHFLIQTERS
ncbi:hypothetical protein V1478_010959 [Vespula squamosa]|uniref:Uncharacterized protein n=1 Tax=Vespula squamosa TaxID=30214 RepID=A0ABD2AGT7_VESSQ